jgi:hypothetical protein
MKTFLLVIISSSLVFSACNAQEKKNETINEEIEIAQDSVEVGWPKDINGLIEHLNSWYKDELDAYERPDIYPNFKASGETNGWISLHKELLKELGATVIWNKEKMKYELKKD